MEVFALLQATGRPVNTVEKESTAEALAQNAGSIGINMREMRFFIVAGGKEESEGVRGHEFRPPAVGDNLLGLFHVKDGAAARAFKLVDFRAAQLALGADLAVAMRVFVLFGMPPGSHQGLLSIRIG